MLGFVSGGFFSIGMPDTARQMIGLVRDPHPRKGKLASLKVKFTTVWMVYQTRRK